MENLLLQATQLETLEYLHLKNPIFKGQTPIDNNNMYWLVFEEDGKLYKFHKHL